MPLILRDRGAGANPLRGDEAPGRIGAGRAGRHRKDGRRKLHFLNPVPIREISDRWIDKYRARALDALMDLKNRLEGTT